MSNVLFDHPLARQYSAYGALSIALQSNCPFDAKHVRGKFNALSNAEKGAVLQLIFKEKGDSVDIGRISKILLIHAKLLKQHMTLSDGRDLETYQATRNANFSKLIAERIQDNRID